MNYELLNKGLLLKNKRKILVISDVHIGYEEALNKQGILIPRTQLKKIKQELNKIFKKTGMINEIVINGDLKHEFGHVSSQEWKDVLDFLGFLEKKCKKIVLIRGNHDIILEPLARRKNMRIKEKYIVEDTAFIHGDKYDLAVLDKGIKRMVIGHKHPAIVIRKGARSETYKCFLIGKWKGKEIIILPSFFPLVEGTDITREDRNLAFPFKLENFKAYVIGDKIYEFGKVKNVSWLVGE